MGSICCDDDVNASHEGDDGSRAPTTKYSFWNDFREEASLFLELACVNYLTYMGFAACPLIIASYVGRLYGPMYMTAFSLANLTGNLCTQTLVLGLFGAIDTLSPQALGKGDFAEVGRLWIRGVVSSVAIMVPINIPLVLFLEDILIACGEDPTAAHHAHRWYNVFVWSLPFSVVFQSTCKFLTVQRVMTPVIWVSIISTVSIIPMLEVLLNGFDVGFLGSAYAYVLFWVLQTWLLLTYVWFRRPYDERTWPTSSSNNTGAVCVLWKSSMDRTAMKDFVTLGLGGVVAQCEWVFWEALGLVVGKLGVVAMTAHTIPIQIIMNVSILPFACGIALAVRMGITLPNSVARARCIAACVIGISLPLFGIISVLLYAYRKVWISIFLDLHADEIDDGSIGSDADIGIDADNDSAVVYDLTESIWTLVSIFFPVVSLFMLLSGVSSALGKQWVLGTINFFWLWVFGMPIIYYTSIMREDGGLRDGWFWMDVAYGGITVSLIAVFTTTDWYGIQKAIIGRGSSSSSNEKNTDDRLNEDTDQLSVSVSSTSSAANERTALLIVEKSRC
mmetsp:Transcript_116593/g.238489  ORF Transcript_116593/g.238489 Transcript_116593/m.238489 type:complete len:561 (+) Transcript_116593:245-1927(+)|eukprot:CAMPEP_0201192668 /NCGR_PEP_ID=MMETSP0851-20130426/145123_1 /ASSEMBLY_ACC=CAM_ASM_000631 /TAXON_ID=183588 /ORGANISM="Pseudo-nitzschia fraudulenta, Strain WWA7" /LENGTH=560 /DNA_ID=CAMNT_0047479021 /DNA_START=232 /DNA_END=1914 /DNA_ORIENTATION=+